ncbi:MAG: hypothetical protein IJX20_05450 [Alphaproteobacteria bacterium]|nr:hypothetical protein [Alphaproteobacteria bacterium]
MVALDEIAKEQAEIEQREQSSRNNVIEKAQPIHVMHAIGVLDAGSQNSASISVTYFLCVDSSVVVVNKRNAMLPYTLEEAKLIMLKELELKSRKK